MAFRAYLFLSLITLILIAYIITQPSLAPVEKPEEILFLLPPSLYKPLQPFIDQFNSDSPAYKITVYVQPTGSLITRIRLSGEGDVFGSADSEYMKAMMEEGLVHGDKVFLVSYSIPALIVPKGNPSNITRLQDLVAKEVKIAIADPETAPSGKKAVNLLKNNGVYEAVKDRLIILADAAQVAKQVSLGLVDVAVAYHFIHYWYPGETDIVWLDPSEIPGIDCQLIGVLKTSKNPELAERVLKTILEKARMDSGMRKLGYFQAIEDLKNITPYADFQWPIPPACYMGGARG
jgi:molybdate transport system substrate-binding protein